MKTIPLHSKRAFLFFLSLFLFSPLYLFAQSQEELLYKAYETKSYELLDKFFENWRKEKTPITKAEYQSLTEIEKDVYDLFYEFYFPKNTTNLSLSDFEYDYYTKVKYFVILSKIYYSVLISDNYDSLVRIHLKDFLIDTAKHFNPFDINKNNEFGLLSAYAIDCLFRECSIEDSIYNFRPLIRDTTAGILFFDKNYDSLISKFIGDNIVQLGTDNIMQTAHAKGISEEKINFLLPYIYIMASHWGNTWVIETSPVVSSILFSHDRLSARIEYYYPYHSNLSYYKKINGKWVFLLDEMTGVW